VEGFCDFVRLRPEDMGRKRSIVTVTWFRLRKVTTQSNSSAGLGVRSLREQNLSTSKSAMTDRRTDHLTRKRVAEMSADEMRRALLTDHKTGLANRRAYDESEPSPNVALSDVNGLKKLNDRFGYEAGNVLIQRFADVLVSVGLDVYHDKGDEFICQGKSFHELNQKLCQAQRLLRDQPFVVTALDGRLTTINGADFCFGIGTNLKEAEQSLKRQKELAKLSREG
jgi:GGDEF domain-containing protein